MRVLSWNLKHGRAVPAAGHELFEEFAGALAGWEWDVALLQEVPPWWPALLAQRLGADARRVLTSRNSLLPLRIALAQRWPDAIKSSGGGANAILARGQRIEEHRIQRLGWLPERRYMHAVRLGDAWYGNLHAQDRVEQGRLAAATLRRWAGESPAVIGGDFNLRSFSLDGFEWAGGNGVDHVFARGLRARDARVLEHGPLSDHAPLLVWLA
jgi:endonuclease/exonuclease/phosphatase family metal-dependent hydrolase